jgi:putative flippase GtrA
MDTPQAPSRDEGQHRGPPGPLAESAGQFVRFSVVGTIAFVVDAGTLQAALALGADHYSGRLLSYLVAATAAWALNRRYTFRLGAREGLALEWLHYLAANAVGGLVNYLTYAGAVLLFDTVRAWPVLGVAAGSATGLAFNFIANKYWVFKKEKRKEKGGQTTISL